MNTYFPDQMYHRAQGHLGPWDIWFDPADPAHVSRDRDRIRVRVITEPAFAEAALVRSDGSGVPMRLVAQSTTRQVWETEFDAERFEYTFALLTPGGLPVYRVPAGVANAVERLDRWPMVPEAVPHIAVPDWVRGSTIYQIFPERFHSGDPELTPSGAKAWGSPPGWLDFQGGDLVGIGAKAEYLASLGVDAVYVNPIFRAPSTHRYDAIDYYEVDPALGGNDALRSLVATLHGHGIRLIVDASFNHCHPRFFAFADVVEHGKDSAYAGWFVVHDHPPRVLVRPHLLDAFRDPDEYLVYLDRFSEESGVEVVEVEGDGSPVQPTYDAWYGVPSLPRIDLRDPGARQYFLDVAAHWIAEYDIDGWRMDVARYVDFDFWPEFRRAVKAVKPEAYLLAEIMGDATRWLQGDTFDGTMNYTFRQLVLDFAATRSIGGGELVDGLVRMYAGSTPEAVAASQNLIGSHDTARFLHEASGRIDAVRLATTLQMTLPGAVGIYYGDEIGMTGGEEPASRGAFPWHDEHAWDLVTLELTRSLAALRREHPALRHGGFEPRWWSDDAVAYVRSDGSSRVLVVVNRGDDALEVTMTDEGTTSEVAWGEGTAERDGARVTVAAVAPGSAVVVVVD